MKCCIYIYFSDTYYECGHGNTVPTCFYERPCTPGYIFDPTNAGGNCGNGKACCVLQVPGCDNYKEMNAKLKHDVSEFNRPMCEMEDSGVCPEKRPKPITCDKNEFESCINGWTCTYYCSEDLHVYNSKMNRCEEAHVCYESMRDDL